MKEVENDNVVNINAVDAPQKNPDPGIPDGNYDDYKNINDLDQIRKMPETQAARRRIRELLGFWVSDNDKLSRKQLKVNNNRKLGEAFGKCHFHAQGDPRNYSVFAVWAMGKKKLSLDEFMALDVDSQAFDTYVAEFQEFLKSHPTATQDEKVNAENTKAWTELYIECNRKLGEYRFPNIDYSDPAQVKLHMDTLVQLQGLVIDVSQEFEMMTGANNEAAMNAAGGAEGFSKAISNWNTVQNMLSSFTTGYNPGGIPWASFYDNRSQSFSRLANSRLLFGHDANNMLRGKTVSEVSSQASTKELYSASMSGQNIKLKANNLDYLSGKSKDAVKEFEEKYADIEKNAKISFNSTCFEYGANAFASEVLKYGKKQRDALDGKLRDLFSDPQVVDEEVQNEEPTPEAKLALLKSDAYKPLRESMQKAARDLSNNLNQDKFSEIVGLTNPLDVIHINGKSLDELYGEKYQNVNNPADRDLLYLAEIYNAAINDDAHVEADVYILNDKNEPVKAKPYVIARTCAEIEESMAYFAQVNTLNESLTELYKRLKATQSDPKKDVTEKPWTEGSDSYIGMMKALKRAIEVTKLENGATRIDDISKAVEELRRAGKVYTKEHTGFKGIIKAHTKNKGIPRLEAAKWLMGEEMVYELKKIKDLQHLSGNRHEKFNDIQLVSSCLQTCWKDLQQQYEMKPVKWRNGELVMDADPLSVNDPEELPNRTQELLVETKYRDEMRREISKVSKGGMNLSLLDSQFEPNYEDYAKKYMVRQYNIMIKDAGKTPYSKGVEELRKEIMSPGFERKFTDQVRNLKNDEAFRNLVKKDPAHCLTKWANRMKNGNDARHSMLLESSEVYRSLMEADPKNAKARWEQAERVVEQWKKEWKKEEDKISDLKSHIESTTALFDAREPEHENKVEAAYDRLAGILTQSCIKDFVMAKNSVAATELALHPEEVENIKNWITDGLKKDNVLGTREGALEKLNHFRTLKMKAVEYVQKADAPKMDEPKRRNSMVERSKNQMNVQESGRKRSETVMKGPKA